MATTSKRFSFQGRHLAEWLIQLVDKDSELRKVAATLISKWSLDPETTCPKDWVAAPELFSSSVREVIGNPDFPADDFVRKLLLLNIALKDSWTEKVSDDFEREEERDKQLRAKFSNPPTKAEFKRYIRRLSIQAARDCKRFESEPHEVFTTGLATSRVIEALGEELLPAADVLRLMLKHKHKATVASDAIVRMGAKGLTFYPDLIAGILTPDLTHSHARALGSVLRYASHKIPEVMSLTQSRTLQTRLNAINCLRYCGRPCTTASPEVEVNLREQVKSATDESEWYALVSALGSIGQTSETVDLLLQSELSNVGRTSSIIDSLGKMSRDPERVVPWLLEKLESFQEYDPDWTYNGNHERVIAALRNFPRNQTKSCIPLLTNLVWDEPENYYEEGKMVEQPVPDQGVIKFLGEHGSLAMEALPILREVQTIMNRGINPEDQIDDESDFIAEAIRKIERK